jgi:hypothetical protein
MEILELTRASLLSPMFLAFALGVVATLVKSDLKLPEGLYASLSIYLLFAIGLKGGAELSKVPISQVWGPALATVLVGAATTQTSYLAARKLAKFDRVDSSALAAHYGSVSAVTFIAAITFAQSRGAQPEGFMPAMVALLEVPAILLALALANRGTGGVGLGAIARELATGKTILLLVGGIVIGVVSGPEGVVQVEPLFGDLFKGALTIFLLEMGLVAAQRLGDLKQHALRLGLYGMLIPVLNGCLGVLAGSWAGLSEGGAGVLGAMTASASYIAAPAAVRMALPQANPSVYLTASLAVTFPFNLAVGIPLYQSMSALLH